ncbi:ABC transporter ATP-binding protein [Streptomyces sp. NPDC000594]|uniref:ABC transporter ATP-binding protein n=1 Tax=Streptomyces sp. NPDC000594 TaxID=3154261 RepID=UPI0033180188
MSAGSSGGGPESGAEEVSASERLLFGGPLAYDVGWSQHQGAWLSLDLWKMARSLPHLVGTAVRLAHRADARALRAVLVAEGARGVSGAVGLVAVSAVLGHLLGAGAVEERLAAAFPALAVVGVTALLGSLLTSASTAATGALEPKVQRIATERYLELASRVEMAAIEDDQFHRLLDSAGYGADAARRMVTYCAGVLASLVSLAAAGGVLTVLHPALLPLLVLMTAPTAWSSLTIAKHRYVSFHQFVQHARAGRLLGHLLIEQHAAAEIRVHGIGPFLLRHFRGMARTSEREQTRLARIAARAGLVADGARGLATLLTYGALGGLLWSGRMEPAVAGTAILAIRTVSGSLDRLVDQITDLHQESLFVADYETLCAEAGKRAIPTAGAELPDRVGEIVFENVTFTYPASGTGVRPEPTLRGVSCSFPTGKVIALVGENGSGKSTLIKLLCGLYLPDEGGGRIRWDGVDAARAARSEIFRRVALMPQGAYPWPFTARVTVGIGRPEDPMDDTAIRAAAAYAGAETVLDTLPRGLDTLLARGYQGGHQISGGERQKLAIAMARHRNAQILVVDEPTSALDAVAEQKVFDQIRRLADAGQTIVLITHRLHSVRHADLIHVLEKGQVAGSGTFEELMDPGTGIASFRTAYEIQAKAFDRPVPGQAGGSHDEARAERL